MQLPFELQRSVGLVSSIHLLCLPMRWPRNNSKECTDNICLPFRGVYCKELKNDVVNYEKFLTGAGSAIWINTNSGKTKAKMLESEWPGVH